MLHLGKNKHDFMRLLVNSCRWSPAVIRRIWSTQCFLPELCLQPGLLGEEDLAIRKGAVGCFLKYASLSVGAGTHLWQCLQSGYFSCSICLLPARGREGLPSGRRLLALGLVHTLLFAEGSEPTRLSRAVCVAAQPFLVGQKRGRCHTTRGSFGGTAPWQAPLP